ncbi:uncharacterized protein LOC125236807 [Leguminivora glycinivorella]|uniref:uncharacterized protein LOC125236807 n=1 Tax=Leguminivora glycinivorella TaxID=1035111 RepID=UPI00200E880C|nr:uncharacterized protein LOC125236807 [Leguminivora glycinivorella]
MARIMLVVSLVFLTYLQVASTSSSGVKCVQHSECPETMACESESSLCVDPCLAHSKCGTAASCHVYEHLASCRCDPGTEGDPYRSCSSSTVNLLVYGRLG